MKKRLETAADALAFAKEHIPEEVWDTITVEDWPSPNPISGYGKNPEDDCWLIHYSDPKPAGWSQVGGGTTLFVSKTGTIVGSERGE